MLVFLMGFVSRVEGFSRASVFSVLPLVVMAEDSDNPVNDYETYPYDMSTYVNPNDTYVPSDEVKQAKDISSDDFAENDGDYIVKAATLPIVLFCIGVVALIVFNCCLCCGAAKICAKHKEGASCGDACVKIIFAAFIVICFLSAHILYVGYGELGSGFDILRDSASGIGKGFQDLSTYSISLQNHTDNVYDLCATGGCYEKGRQVQRGGDWLYDDIARIPDEIDTIVGYIDDAEQAVNLLTFLMYCCLMVSLVVYILTELCCKASAAGAICCGNIAFFIVALIGVLWMIILTITADFCYENPTVNLLEAMKADKGQMYVIWYSSCYSGENPVYRYLNWTDVHNEAIVSAYASASGSTAEDIRTETAYVSGLLDDLDGVTYDSCPPVQTNWLSFVNDGICGDFFLGVRTIWICEMVACISLFFLMITGAILAMSAKYKESIHPAGAGGDSSQGSHHADHEQGVQMQDHGENNGD